MLSRIRPPRDERGASLVEYALLMSLVAVACVTAVQTLGTDISSAFESITSAI